MRYRASTTLLALACVMMFAADTAAQDPHAGHGAGQPPASPKPQAGAPSESSQSPKEPIPPLTDADRAAAFPPSLGGHAVHDRIISYMVLFDQLEWRGAATGGTTWDNKTWIGGDRNRLWIRTEGESQDRRLESALVDVLWGRAIARWWDIVAGVRQDFRPGTGRTWIGAGIQGLAPYWFEIEATGYVGDQGRTHARVEVEYELLLTNRLIAQPLLEAELYGKADDARGIGAGLSTMEAGLRLRYEVRREFAPYVGITWSRKFFGTGDIAEANGERISGSRVVFGVRTWF